MKAPLVQYRVRDDVWNSSLDLRFQLTFYARARTIRALRGVPRETWQSVSAARVHWGRERIDGRYIGDWTAEVREGSAADRHLVAVLHNMANASSISRRVVS